MEVFSARLKWLRNKRGYTQAKVAELIGMSSPGYTKIEQGNREPNLDTLVKLSKILSESTDFLLGVTDFDKKSELESKEIDNILSRIFMLNSTLKEKKIEIENTTSKDIEKLQNGQLISSMLLSELYNFKNKFEVSKNNLIKDLKEIPLLSQHSIDLLNNLSKSIDDVSTDSS